MKRFTAKWIPILLAAALLLTMCACGSNFAPSGSYMYNGTAADNAYEAEATAPQMSSAPQEPASPPSPGYSGTGKVQTDLYANLPENVKMIFTANLEMETTEFDLAVQQIAQTVAEMEGYFQERNMRNYGSYRAADFTVRVPAEQFQSFCSKMGEVCKVTRFNDSSENVGEQYYDTEARLATQRTKLERLQELLSKAEEMEDIITLESAISDTEYVIEQLTGTHILERVVEHLQAQRNQRLAVGAGIYDERIAGGPHSGAGGAQRIDQLPGQARKPEVIAPMQEARHAVFVHLQADDAVAAGRHGDRPAGQALLRSVGVVAPALSDVSFEEGADAFRRRNGYLQQSSVVVFHTRACVDELEALEQLMHDSRRFGI